MHIPRVDAAQAGQPLARPSQQPSEAGFAVLLAAFGAGVAVGHEPQPAEPTREARNPGGFAGWDHLATPSPTQQRPGDHATLKLVPLGGSVEAALSTVADTRARMLTDAEPPGRARSAVAHGIEERTARGVGLPVVLFPSVATPAPPKEPLSAGEDTPVVVDNGDRSEQRRHGLHVLSEDTPVLDQPPGPQPHTRGLSGHAGQLSPGRFSGRPEAPARDTKEFTSAAGSAQGPSASRPLAAAFGTPEPVIGVGPAAPIWNGVPERSEPETQPSPAGGDVATEATTSDLLLPRRAALREDASRILPSRSSLPNAGVEAQKSETRQPDAVLLDPAFDRSGGDRGAGGLTDQLMDVPLSGPAELVMQGPLPDDRALTGPNATPGENSEQLGDGGPEPETQGRSPAPGPTSRSIPGTSELPFSERPLASAVPRTRERSSNGRMERPSERIDHVSGPAAEPLRHASPSVADYHGNGHIPVVHRRMAQPRFYQSAHEVRPSATRHKDEELARRETGGGGLLSDTHGSRGAARVDAPFHDGPRSTLFEVRLSEAIVESLKGQRVRVRIEPPELGEVEVEVSRRVDGLEARFHVTTERAAHMIAERLHDLRLLLLSHGLDLTEASVFFNQGGGEQRLDSEGRFGRDHWRGQSARRPAGPDAPRSVSARSPRHVRHGLNILA